MSSERLQEMIYRELDWVPQVEEDNGNLIIRYVNRDILVISNRTRMIRLVASNFDYLNKNKLRELHLLIYKYILQEEELRNKKYKYKVPEFLSIVDPLHLVRDFNEDFFHIGYGEPSGICIQTRFTDEEMEKIIEKQGEDFRKFIELCEKVEVEQMSYKPHDHNNYEELLSQEILSKVSDLIYSIGETEISLKGTTEEYVIKVDISVEKVEVE